jgi:hypothetical protein
MEYATLEDMFDSMRAKRGEGMKEQIARYAHESWSGWLEYLFSKSTSNADGTVTIPADLVARWRRQMKTDYAKLPESEKESDRAEAAKIFVAVFGKDGL